MGFIDNHLSPFEHWLIGSTVDKKYNGKPYTPLIIQDGGDISECGWNRVLLGGYGGGYIALPSKFSVRGTSGVITLPRLNSLGELVEDPILLTTDGMGKKRDHSRLGVWRDGPYVGSRKVGLNSPFQEKFCAPGDEVYLYEDGQVVSGIILGNGSRDNKISLGFRPVKNLTYPDLILCELGGLVRLEKQVGRDYSGGWHLEPVD